MQVFLRYKQQNGWKNGVEWDQLISNLNEVSRKEQKFFFNVATLEYLQKGGRIGLVASILGTALKATQSSPVMMKGIYYTVGKARGRKKFG